MPHFPPVIFAIAFAVLVVALTALARRLPIPTPILQVGAGLLVAVVPGVEIPALQPDLVFFVFLPPILWAAAFFTSLREFKANRRPIGYLAIGLVLATTVAVAVAARALLPGLQWAVEAAVQTFRDPAQWRRLIANGMAEDFSWKVQGTLYELLYARLVA